MNGMTIEYEYCLNTLFLVPANVYTEIRQLSWYVC